MMTSPSSADAHVVRASASRSPSIAASYIDRIAYGDREPLSESEFTRTPLLEFDGVPDSLKPVMRDLQHGAPWFPPNTFVSVSMNPNWYTGPNDASGETVMNYNEERGLEAVITMPRKPDIESDDGKGRSLYAFFHEYVAHGMVGAQTDAKMVDLSGMVEHKRLYHPNDRGERPWHYMIKANLHRIPVASRPAFLDMYAQDMGTLALLDLMGKQNSELYDPSIDLPMADAGRAWREELQGKAANPNDVFWQVSGQERDLYAGVNPMRLRQQDKLDQDFYG